MSEKWGVVGLGVTKTGTILSFPKNPENSGKFEKVLGAETAMEDIGEMSEMLGGAVEERDWVGLENVLSYALIREACEERGLDLSPDQLQLMPEGMEVLQYRGSKDVNFLVACFVIQLNSEQERSLRENGAVDLRDVNDLRPRDRELVNMYQKIIGIPVEVAEEVYA